MTVDLETGEVAFVGILAWPVEAPTPAGEDDRETASVPNRVRDVLPESHREALRDAAIAYLDECFSAIADSEPGQSYANTPSGSYLPLRIESRGHELRGLDLEQKDLSGDLFGEVHIRPDRPVSP